MECPHIIIPNEDFVYTSVDIKIISNRLIEFNNILVYYDQFNYIYKKTYMLLLKRTSIFINEIKDDMKLCGENPGHTHLVEEIYKNLKKISKKKIINSLSLFTSKEEYKYYEYLNNGDIYREYNWK